MFQAQAAKFAAEALALTVEQKRGEAYLISARAEAEKDVIGLHVVQRSERKELAKNEHHHLYMFAQAVGDATAAECMLRLTEWMRNDPKCDIEIVFNSPGGSVVAGLALWDFIQTVRAEGHKVTTSTIGYAASMAGILLQAGDTRVMGKQSWLLIHEASFQAAGKIGEVEDTVDWIKRVCNRIVDIFIERCQGADPKTAKHPLTKRRLVTNWTRKDWWIDADQALDWGLVDEIRG
jgi:ATP-dependent Clp endopeptidase proteolytic subunit ClpP